MGSRVEITKVNEAMLSLCGWWAVNHNAPSLEELVRSGKQSASGNDAGGRSTPPFVIVRALLRKNMAEKRPVSGRETRAGCVVWAARRELSSQVSPTETDDECSRFTDHKPWPCRARPQDL